MATVVEGRRLAKELRSEARAAAEKLEGGPPCLAAVIVGEDASSQIYVRDKRRAFERAGMASRLIQLPADTSESELLGRVHELNRDPTVTGVLVQLPLPEHIDATRVAATVSPAKDVDGLHPENVGKLVAGAPGLYPCTPLGCLAILDRYEVPIEGARAVVIGRSEIVGKPLALLLLHRHATVTLCHSRTRDLPEMVGEADILVAAMGKPGFVKGAWIKPGAAVIDVGMNRIAPRRVVGDVEFDAACERAGLITPVPGGVGVLTIAILLHNTLRAFELQHTP